jgi:transposase
VKILLKKAKKAISIKEEIRIDMRYPSDVSDKEWSIIEPLVRYQGYCRPRKHDLRKIVNGIFYLQRTGCQWRMLPSDFPPWKSVYDHYYRWRLNGKWDEIHNILRDRLRAKEGKKPVPTVAIIDSRSVKTAQKGGAGDMTQAKKLRDASIT